MKKHLAKQASVELELKRLVFKKTAGFSWRPNFRTWRQVRINQEEYQLVHLSLLERYLPDFPKLRILDVGCGMGGLITALKLAGAKDVFGVEFDLDYCRLSQLRGERHRLSVTPINGVGETLPVKDSCVDLVTCFEVLEHTDDYLKVLAEIKRILRPNGQAIITIPNRLGFFDPHYHLPLINWFPRTIAERVLHLLAREARGLADRQKLSEMHYVTYWGIRQNLKALGVEVVDLLRPRFTRQDKIETALIRNLIKVTNKSSLTPVLYWLFASFFLDSFQFLLKKPR